VVDVVVDVLVRVEVRARDRRERPNDPRAAIAGDHASCLEHCGVDHDLGLSSVRDYDHTSSTIDPSREALLLIRRISRDCDLWTEWLEDTSTVASPGLGAESDVTRRGRDEAPPWRRGLDVQVQT
jgi:hypothetical protein